MGKGEDLSFVGLFQGWLFITTRKGITAMKCVYVGASVVLFLALAGINGMNFVRPLDRDELKWEVKEKVRQAAVSSPDKAIPLYHEAAMALNRMKLADGTAIRVLFQRMADLAGEDTSTPAPTADHVWSLAVADLAAIDWPLSAFCIWASILAAAVIVGCGLFELGRSFLRKSGGGNGNGALMGQP